MLFYNKTIKIRTPENVKPPYHVQLDELMVVGGVDILWRVRFLMILL